jgi:drug/metabolite transporter (DMT)-like permease
VTLSVQLGVLMAAVTAFASIVGFLLKHRGAVAAPPVELRHPVRSTADLFRSPVYAIGCVVATTSWGFHVAALALAPISIVQSVIAGGLVMLTVTADRVFGQRVTRREWIGVALTAAGLAFLAATLEGTGDSAHSAHDAGTLAGYIGLATLAGLALVPFARRRPDGIVLAVSAGFLWGASDVAIKAISAHSDRGIAVVVHPLALVILVLSLVGLLVSARSLQLGPVVAVIAVTSATANIFTIASGPIVFGEPLPDRPLGVVLRLLAFTLVIGAAALTPPPRAPELSAAR